MEVKENLLERMMENEHWYFNCSLGKKAKILNFEYEISPSDQ